MENSDEGSPAGGPHDPRGTGDPLDAAMQSARMPVILTDPRQTDNPIVYVNDAFCRMTGYSREESIGRNCRFLQGSGTDPAAVADLRASIEAGREISIELLNYRKDGTAFWNAVHVSPVSAGDGELRYFLSTQVDATAAHRAKRPATEPGHEALVDRVAELERALEAKTLLLHEVDHRVKNNLQMISAMMRKQLRLATDAAAQEALQAALARVEVLGIVHRRLYESADLIRFSVAEFIRETASDLLRAADRSEIVLDFELEDFTVPAKSASAFSLLVNELLTNALKHAFPERGRQGRISVQTRVDADGMTMTIEDDGVGFDPSLPQRQTFGRRLIEALVSQIGGGLEWSDAGPGTRATLTMPAQAA